MATRKEARESERERRHLRDSVGERAEGEIEVTRKREGGRGNERKEERKRERGNESERERQRERDHERETTREGGRERRVRGSTSGTVREEREIKREENTGGKGRDSQTKATSIRKSRSAKRDTHRERESDERD